MTTTTCLLAGIPQILLPQTLEQSLIAIALDQLGVSKTLTQPTWDGLVMAQAQTYTLTDQAQQQAQRLAPWNQNFMDRIVDDCLKRLQAGTRV